MSSRSAATKGGRVDEDGVPLTGCLELVVLAGMNLYKAEFMRKNNCFVTITFNNEPFGQTEVISGTQDPEWGQTFILPVPYGRDLSVCVLELRIYHRKSEANDVLIGYRRFEGSEMVYIGNIADELASYEAESEDGGPPPDLGVFELHIEHKMGERPKKTKGNIQLIGNFHPHIVPALVEDGDDDTDDHTDDDTALHTLKTYLTLDIRLEAALDIANANGINGSFQGKSNPFGLLRVNGMELHRTSILADTLSPVWHDELVEIRLPVDFDFLNIFLEIEIWHSAHPRKHKRTKLLGYHSFNANQVAELTGVTVLEIMLALDSTHTQMLAYFEDKNGSKIDGESNSNRRKVSSSDSPSKLPPSPSSRQSSDYPLSPTLKSHRSSVNSTIGDGSAQEDAQRVSIFERGIPVWLDLQRHLQRPKEDALLVQGAFKVCMNFRTPPSEAEALSPLPLGKHLKVVGDLNVISKVPTRDAKSDAVLVVSVMSICGPCVKEALEKLRGHNSEAADGATKSTSKSLLIKKKPITSASPPPLYCIIRDMYGEVIGKTEILREEFSTRWEGQKFWLTFPIRNHDMFPTVFSVEVLCQSRPCDIVVGEVTISAKDVLKACSHPDYRLQDDAPKEFNAFVPTSGMRWFKLEKPPHDLEIDELFMPDGDNEDNHLTESNALQVICKENSSMKSSSELRPSASHGRINTSSSLPEDKTIPPGREKNPSAGKIELKFQIRPPPYTEEDDEEEMDEFSNDITVDHNDLISIHSECETSGEICIRVPSIRGGSSSDPKKKIKLAGRKKNAKVYACLYFNGICIGRTNTPKLQQVTRFDKSLEFFASLPLSYKLENCHLEIELYKTTPCKITEDNPLGVVTSSMGCVQLRGKSLREQLFESKEEEDEEDVNDDAFAGKCVLPIEESRRSFSVEAENPDVLGGYLDVTAKYIPPEKPVYTPPDEVFDPDMDREIAYTPACITVTICEAANLGNADLLGRSDPYVVVIWNGVEEGRTSIVQNSLNPVWVDQVFRLIVPRNRDVLSCTLELHVFDDNTVGLDVFLGCKILSGPSLQSLLTNTADENCPEAVWVDLKKSRLLSSKQNRLVQGSLSITCQYTDSYRRLRRYSVDHVKIELFLFAGEGLTKLHGKGKPNCFCVVKWEGKEVGRTAAVRKAYNPQWDFIDENLNRFTIYFPDKQLENPDVSICDIEVLVYHSDLCKHSEKLEDCLCLGRAFLPGKDIHAALLKTPNSSASSGDIEIHPFRIMMEPAPDALSRPSKPLEPSGSLEIGLMVKNSHNRQESLLRITSGGDDSRCESPIDLLPPTALEEMSSNVDVSISAGEAQEAVENMTDATAAQSQALALLQTPVRESEYRMYFDNQSCSFYYINKYTNESSWDKPVDGAVSLYKSEEEVAAIELAQSSFLKEKEAKLAHLRTAVANIRADYAEEQQRIALDKKLQADRVVVAAWRQALFIASREHGECNISWQKVPVVHPMAYEFEKTYGMCLRAIRLVGCGVESIPEEVFERLHSLEYLSLSNNSLQHLPDSLCGLFHLKHLDIKDNEIKQLPPKIGRLATNLSRIEMTNNKLESLPHSFAALQKIERLDLTFNCLRVLPENLDLMQHLRVVKVNNNCLIRLPRCLGRMKAITSFSANSNNINYIPVEAAKCENLEVLRLCANRISYLPENIGNLRNLRELWLDHNYISFLPTKFCQLINLRVLHLEENRTLTSPDMSIIHQGAQAVVEWSTKRFLEDEHWRRKRIIVAFQDCLRQIAELDICDPGKFQTPHRIKDDDYYCLDLSYFWRFILPELTKVWKRRIEEYEEVPPDVVLSFPYTKQEVLWAFKTFQDAYGYVLQTGVANFRRCLCRDKDGNRRVCVPPAKGFMCRRRCQLVKHHCVLQHEKELRYWMAYKRSETELAVKRAEAEALKYLKSDDGKLWIAEMSFERAEEVMNISGLNNRKDWREKLAEKRKAKIVKKWDKRKAKFERSKQVASAQILLEIDELKSKERLASEGGYAKESLGRELAELHQQLTELPEVAIIEEYTKKCEQECNAVEDDLLYNDSSDSSDNYVRETYRQRKRRELMEMEKAAKESATGAMPIVWEEPKPTPLKDFAMSLFDFIPPKERRQKQLHRAKRRLKRRLRNAMDMVAMRYTKMKLMSNGQFKEIQQELEHETYHQHISNAAATARRTAERQFYVIGKIRNQWKGLGLEVCFLGWKKYTKDKTKREKADLRSKYRLQKKKYHADLINYRIAEAQVLMWKKYSDVYTDMPFWRHWQSGEVRWDKPKIEDFVPNGFDMPVPPTPLPGGMEEDTTDSEHDPNEFIPKGNYREPDKDLLLQRELEAKEEASSVVSSQESLESSARLLAIQEESESSTASRAMGLELSLSDAASTESELTTASSVRFIDEASLASSRSMTSLRSQNKRAVVPRNADHDFSGQQWVPRLPVLVPSRAVQSSSMISSGGVSNSGLRFPLTSSREENVLQKYSYGPDSLRAQSLGGRVGRAVFQDEQELQGFEDGEDESVLSFDPGPVGQALLDAYSTRGGASKSPRLSQEQKMALALESTAKRAKEEQDASLEIVNKKRLAMRKVRGITYLRQRDRRPRAHQELYEERKRREQEAKRFQRPSTPELLRMVQGNPDQVWRSSDMAIRTDLASKAVKLKESMRQRAVKEGLIEDKKKSFFQEHILPAISSEYTAKLDPNYD